MMPLTEWKEGLSIWQNVKKQAEVSLETADLIIPVFEKKILELEALEQENGK